MENILTNLSVWGVLLVLLTTLRITFWKSITKTSYVSGLFLQQIHVFIQQAYKPLTLTVLSAFILFVCYKITGDRYISMWVSAVMGGVLSIGISALIKPAIAGLSANTSRGINEHKRFNAVQLILDEKHIQNGGTYFMGLLSLLWVVADYQTAIIWNAYAVLSLAASFALGAAGLLLCISIYEFAANHYTLTKTNNPVALTTLSGRFLRNDRFDTLSGTLVAAMLLGTTMCDLSTYQNIWIPASPVILPLVLTISGVGISSIAALIAKLNGWKKDPIVYLTEKMVSAILMIICAFLIIQYLLPASWVCNGIEYTSMQVFYAAQAGVIGGLLTNKVVQGYRAFHRKYFSYLAGKAFQATSMDSAFHFVINALSAILPVLLITLPILFSFQLVGLYGIVIALITMLANLSTRLTIGR